MIANILGAQKLALDSGDKKTDFGDYKVLKNHRCNRQKYR
jgi:hypothetical protein